MSRPSNKKIIVLTLSVLIIGAVAGAYKFISMPATGYVAPPPKTAAPVADKPITVNGQYGSFSYPSSFVATPVSKPVAPVVEAFSYVRHKTGSWELDVQFTRTETGSLDDNGGYNFRNKTPSRFLKTTENANGQTAIIFTDQMQQPFGKVAYLKQGTMNVSISLMGGSSNDSAALQSIFNAVIASLRFK